MTTSLAELLTLRFQFEQIVAFRKTYDLPTHTGDLNSLYYFIEHGAKKNRFRKRYNEALDLAKKIIESYENEKTNLSIKIS